MGKIGLFTNFLILGAVATLATACTAASTQNTAETGRSTASASSASTAPASSATPASNSSLPECRNSDVLIFQQTGNGAGGHSLLLLGFENISTRTCFLRGYPGVAAIDSSGRVLVNADRVLNGMMGLAVNADVTLTAPPVVVLRPQQVGLAALEWESVDPLPGVPGGCLAPHADALLVTAPDATVSTKFTGGFNYICGNLEINPVIDKDPRP